ncbi:MAG TPA: DUF4231 domain-containing protein [Pirellulaceae bacterium]|nr:DUF4231 domain-containing protein [Pirellulaceae bacterium]
MSEPVSRHDYLVKTLDDSIKWFRKEANKHKKVFNWCRYSIFVLTVVSTVLASVAVALEGPSQKVLNVFLVFTTAAIGAVASVEGMRKPADKWHTERRTEYLLLDVKRELEYQALPAGDSEGLDQCFERMQDILRASGESWSKHHQDAAKTTQAAPAVPHRGQG